MTNKEQMILLKIKSLLNHLKYFIKEDHLKVVDEYYKICRKYCKVGTMAT